PAGDFWGNAQPREISMTMLRMLAAVSVAAFALHAGPVAAEMKKEWVEYSHAEAKLKANMVYDDSVTGRRPAILMIHAREGMTPKTQQLADNWAKLGYVAFAASCCVFGVMPSRAWIIRMAGRRPVTLSS